MDAPSLIPEPVRVGPFKGLNNRIDPTALGLEWQLQAENALCDDAGYLTRAPSPVQQPGGPYKDMFATRNGRLLLITGDDRLVERGPSGVESALAEGVLGAPFAWAELGYALFLMSPHGRWMVTPDRLMHWGIDAGGGDDPGCAGPPVGHLIAAQRSRIAVAVYEQELDRSVLYFSRADYPHEFRLDRDFQLFHGRINLVVTLSKGSVIATDKAIYVDYFSQPMERVADYGVMPNALVSDDRDIAWFWSQRGLCRAVPFENMTDKQLVPELRQRLAAGALYWQGSSYAVINQHGPAAAHMPRPFVPLPTVLQ